MGNPSDNIRKRRNDLSPFLFHFTNYEALCSILYEECIKSECGYQCFTEAPLTSMLELLDYMATFRKPILRQFAIGFSRDILISKYSARPVILGSMEELSIIDNSFDWRKQKIDVHNYDFEWLREWRIRGSFDFSTIGKENIIIVTKEETELDCLQYEYKLRDVCLDDNNKFVDADIEIKRVYRGIPLNIIQNKKLKNDHEMKEILDRQEIGIVDE